MPKDVKARAETNTTITISLSKALRKRIEAAAEEDKRKVSPWCVIQLEKILDVLEAKQEERDSQASEVQKILKAK